MSHLVHFSRQFPPLRRFGPHHQTPSPILSCHILPPFLEILFPFICFSTATPHVRPTFLLLVPCCYISYIYVHVMSRLFFNAFAVAVEIQKNATTSSSIISWTRHARHKPANNFVYELWDPNFPIDASFGNNIANLLTV